MLETAELIAFVASTDLERSRTFYETTLGLRFVEQSPYACVFDARGTMLRVTLVAPAGAPDHTVLGWRVADITGAVRDLAERGVPTTWFSGMDQDDDGVWTTPGGDRVAWFTDPDGNTLSFTQFC